MEFPAEAIVSTRLTRKGPLIGETYAAFQAWDLESTFQQNLGRLQKDNPFGAKTEKWLREVMRTFSTRFRGLQIRPLVVLAKAGCPVDVWRSCLLWHLGRRDRLYYEFSADWLYPAYLSGMYALRTRNLVTFVQCITRGGLKGAADISEYGATRLARDLLMAASLFGILEGSVAKTFTHRHLNGISFLYVVYAIAEAASQGRGLIDSADWRLFLMGPSEVERELHELHQFQKVNIEMAGSIVDLRLPAKSLNEYAEMVAQERNWNG